MNVCNDVEINFPLINHVLDGTYLPVIHKLNLLLYVIHNRSL